MKMLSRRLNDFIAISAPSALGHIDSPNQDISLSQKSYSNEINVAGWALNYPGTSRVDAYIDLRTGQKKFYSTVSGNNSSTIVRPDVESAVDPKHSYQNHASSGFTINIPQGSTPGRHHLRHGLHRHNDGTVTWQTRTFTVQ